MEFDRKKLPKEAAANLRICGINTVRPYALMLAPVYIFLRRNEKFLSVKAPLDFFTPEELERLSSSESFFFPDAVERALYFRNAATSLKAILSSRVPVVSYELSDAVLRLLAPLWGKEMQIEPFMIAVFVNELCDLLPPDQLVDAREHSVEVFETAVFRACVAVFFAVHLGYLDRKYLSRLYHRVFTEQVANILRLKVNSEIDDVIALSARIFSDLATRIIRAADFEGRPEKAAHKLASRLKRAKLLLEPPAEATSEPTPESVPKEIPAVSEEPQQPEVLDEVAAEARIEEILGKFSDG